jgi:hypothetical protein
MKTYRPAIPHEGDVLFADSRDPSKKNSFKPNGPFKGHPTLLKRYFLLSKKETLKTPVTLARF